MGGFFIDWSALPRQDHVVCKHEAYAMMQDYVDEMSDGQTSLKATHEVLASKWHSAFKFQNS